MPPPSAGWCRGWLVPFPLPRPCCFDKNLFIDINNLSPYFETNGVRILNQKWHVLISMLAVYDIASFDDEIINNDDLKKYNIGKIKEIHINEKSIKIEGERQTKILKSKMMIKWLTMILNDRG